MKMALKGHTLSIKEADEVQFSIIMSWNLMHYDKQTKSLIGNATLDLLEKLDSMERVRLPSGGDINPETGKPYPDIAEYYRNLKRVKKAVDAERFEENPIPIYEPPVKVPLYKHQVRAYDMAMITFGWVDLPEEEE